MFDKKKDSELDSPVPGTTPERHTARNSKSESGTTATIGSSIHVQGDISGSESLIIYGKVEGKISLPKNDVIVGNSGQINADINAKTIQIEGEVNGDITGEEKVVISKTGRVRGNIIAPRMTLEDGAKFKGSIDMDPDESSKTVLPGTKNSSTNFKG